MLGLGVMATAASLGACEIALRILLRPPAVYRLLQPGLRRVFDPDPALAQGISGPARFTVNDDGIRARRFGAPGAEVRILLVGGSTTECALLDEPETWGGIVEAELGQARDGRPVWVGNVGRAGHTARDHAVAVKFLLPQYGGMDLLLVLVGVNDLTAALRQGDAYQMPPPVTDSAAERLQIRRTFVLAPGALHEPATGILLSDDAPWYKSTALFQLVKRAWMNRQARTLVQDGAGRNYGRWRANRRSASALLDRLPDLDAPLEEYRRNLRAITQAARAAGAQLVFMTQPTLWKPSGSSAEEARLWLGGTGAFQEEPGHAYYSVPALADAMRRYNAATLEVCGQEGLACLDLARLVPADTSMLFDDVHFTEAGAAQVGRAVAAHLRDIRPDLFAARTSR